MELILNKQFFSNRSLCLLVFFIFISTIIIYSNKNNIFKYKLNKTLNKTSRYPYIALIVDDRANQLVINAVNNVLEHIPIDWKVQIMTLYEHWSYYNKSSLNQYIKSDRVLLTRLNQSSNGLSSDEYINSILTSSSFWHQIYGDKVLLFQIDSVLCSNSSYNLTNFLQYDFIGAPWYLGGCCNGGLSLRNRLKILELIESNKYHYRLHGINEDGWFTEHLSYVNGYVAPVSIAKKFSVETIYHPRPFAVHKPHINTIGLNNMNHLCNECPEVRMIVSYCEKNMKNINTTS
ncbi:unnamed protein product [Rotaria sp. Silwood2]|nr:unnamed protein product [Rotaria sp. Silwood2]CAF4455053.1 unnamed protein product [Rotaria sp. Silwood2]